MTISLVNANSLSIPLAPQSVHMVATSPPYWGLRDYQNAAQLGQEPLHDCLAWARGERPCKACYVCRIRKVAAEVWRVLRDDGTFWLNLGDSFAAGGKGGAWDEGRSQFSPKQTTPGYHYAKQSNREKVPGLKPKDLAMIPARVALALQSDGWYLRSDIIWSKTNPMSESVNGVRWERHRVQVKKSQRAKPEHYHALAYDKPQSERDGREWADQESRYEDCPGCDECERHGGYILRRGAWRPTKAHEYIFMLAKSERYYCDKYAVTEPLAESSIQRINQPSFDQQTGGEKDYRNGTNPNRSARQALENLKSSVKFGGNKADGYGRTTYSGNEWEPSGNGRNKWTVWEISTKGYPGAHFAVWPAELVEPMIKAGTSERGCCPHCGAQWARVINKGKPEPTKSNPNPVRPYEAASSTQANGSTTLHMMRITETVDWMPTCGCPEHNPIPCTVLDIFAGSGTTLEKARELGRNGIGLDVSFDYLVNEAKTRLMITAVEALENGTGLVSAPSRKQPAKVSEAQLSFF